MQGRTGSLPQSRGRLALLTLSAWPEQLGTPGVSGTRWAMSEMGPLFSQLTSVSAPVWHRLSTRKGKAHRDLPPPRLPTDKRGTKETCETHPRAAPLTPLTDWLPSVCSLDSSHWQRLPQWLLGGQGEVASVLRLGLVLHSPAKECNSLNSC